MGLIGSLVGGALGIGGSIFGNVAASKAMKQVKANINNKKEEYQDWYNRNYNMDSTQRADAQRLLTITNEQIKERNRAAAGAQAVGGGTEASMAAQRAANSQAAAETASQIAAAGEARKERVEQQYMAKKDELDNQLNALEQQRAANTMAAAQGVANAGAGMAGLF